MSEKDNYYSKIAMSNTALSALNPDEGGSPQKFINFMRGETDKEESDAIRLGSIVHKYLENPESFTMTRNNRPDNVMGEIVDFLVSKNTLFEDIDKEHVINTCRRKDYGASNWKDDTLYKKVEEHKEYINEMVNCSLEGKTPISGGLREKLKGIRMSAERNKELCNILNPSFDCITAEEKELNMVYQGILFKGKIDKFIYNSNILVDFKTGRTPAGKYMEYKRLCFDKHQRYEYETVLGSFYIHHVYRQFALYNLLMESNGNRVDSNVCCYIETVPPYDITIFDNIPKPALTLGCQEVDSLIKMFKYTFGDWKQFVDNYLK